jgi:acyl dehydratase
MTTIQQAEEIFSNKTISSQWLKITQDMISDFGRLTLDPDPMHINPEWAKENSPYGSTISFGFLTLSLLTHMLHEATGTSSQRESGEGESSYYLNYGFDNVRFLAPVKVGSKVRGVFTTNTVEEDTSGRIKIAIDCIIEIEGNTRPALAAKWIALWVAPNNG